MKKSLLLKKSLRSKSLVISTESVLVPIKNSDGRYVFFCPGCVGFHIVDTNQKLYSRHKLSGTLLKPTIKPSILSIGDIKINKPHCHSFVTNGKIHFLTDCSHNLAGQTIRLFPPA